MPLLRSSSGLEKVLLVWSRAQDSRCSSFKLTYTDIQSDLLDLLMTLLSLPAARTLQSRNGDSTLSGDLAFFYSQISSHAVDVRSTIRLLTQAIEPAPDVAIWNEVFALVARSTTTPTNSFKLEPDTPFKSTTSSQQDSEQTHAGIDPRILQEVDLCLYENTKGFYKKYFEDKPWTSSVARFAQEANPQIRNGRRTDYPYPPTQIAFFRWFWNLLPTFPSEKRNTCYTSFNKPLDGSGGNRQPDLFLAPLNTEKCNERHHWRDVRVIGELKESVSKNSLQEVARFCGYAREVFTNQPTRLFLHGFFLRGSIMELWVCDRSGPYSCERLDAHKDPERFLEVIVAYTMMRDDELGLNMFIKGDNKTGKWIMFKEEGKTIEERLDLEDQPIAFQRAIVCRGTTCYRAKRQGVSRWEFVVKFRGDRTRG